MIHRYLMNMLPMYHIKIAPLLPLLIWGVTALLWSHFDTSFVAIVWILLVKFVIPTLLYRAQNWQDIEYVHSHLLTTRIPFHSDFPFFRILIVSVLMILPKMLICLRNHQLDLWKILVYGNINKKQISTLVMLMTLFDLQMTFVNDQWEWVVLPNLRNKMLHILIPHLLQLTEYNLSYGEKCYP